MTLYIQTDIGHYIGQPNGDELVMSKKEYSLEIYMAWIRFGNVYKTALVTVLGFIGYHISKKLLKEGWRVPEWTACLIITM